VSKTIPPQLWYSVCDYEWPAHCNKLERLLREQPRTGPQTSIHISAVTYNPKLFRSCVLKINCPETTSTKYRTTVSSFNWGYFKSDLFNKTVWFKRCNFFNGSLSGKLLYNPTNMWISSVQHVLHTINSLMITSLRSPRITQSLGICKKRFSRRLLWRWLSSGL
jgi:hypothetical protein